MTDRRQRGFALVTALAIAILYFSLMELLLIDTSRAMAEAQRFRARVVAATLAENGAELAALHMVTKSGSTVTGQLAQGTIQGKYVRNGDSFQLEGEGIATGAMRQDASVSVQGRIDPTNGSIKIDYTRHGQ